MAQDVYGEEVQIEEGMDQMNPDQMQYQVDGQNMEMVQDMGDYGEDDYGEEDEQEYYEPQTEEEMAQLQML